MRSLSSAAKSAIFASETGEVFVVLLELSHPDLAESIRVSSDNATALPGGLYGTQHGGNDYQHFPFQVTLASEPEDRPPSARLRIDNVDRRVVEAIRTVSGPIAISKTLVLASSPEVTESGPFEFTLRRVRYSANAVEGELVYEDFLSEPYPAGTFGPAGFAGLF